MKVNNFFLDLCQCLYVSDIWENIIYIYFHAFWHFSSRTLYLRWRRFYPPRHIWCHSLAFKSLVHCVRLSTDQRRFMNSSWEQNLNLSHHLRYPGFWFQLEIFSSPAAILLRIDVLSHGTNTPDRAGTLICGIKNM